MAKQNGGGKLRRTRLKYGISLRAMAQDAGISATYLSMIERGIATPSLKRRAIIEKLLAEAKRTAD